MFYPLSWAAVRHHWGVTDVSLYVHDCC